jgi:hypothetical protein
LVLTRVHCFVFTAGDPDMYISACGGSLTSPCVYTPTSGNYTWRHSNVGADTVVVQWGAPNSCVPVAGSPCSYYIGVHGYSASQFSVLAYLHNDTAVTLIDGFPQSGRVNASVSDQYQFDVPAGSGGVEVTLIPISGDADLYIRVDGQKPRPDFAQYRSIAANGNDNVNVYDSDPQFIAAHCVSDGCRMTIAVAGFQPRCVPWCGCDVLACLIHARVWGPLCRPRHRALTPRAIACPAAFCVCRWAICSNTPLFRSIMHASAAHVCVCARAASTRSSPASRTARRRCCRACRCATPSSAARTTTTS